MTCHGMQTLETVLPSYMAERFLDPCMIAGMSTSSVNCPNPRQAWLESDEAVVDMIQRQITHAAGSFAVCATCVKEPLHFMASGSTRHEHVTFATNGERHQLECNCERRTGWRNSFADAVLAWKVLGETPSLTPKEMQAGVRPISVCPLPAGKSRQPGSVT